MLGAVDLPGSRIKLNELHPRLAFHRELENAEALIDICLNLIAVETWDSRELSKFKQLRDYPSFAEAYSRLLMGAESTKRDNTLVVEHSD
jgi:hypothetical protein